jgi:hypothetical protein
MTTRVTIEPAGYTIEVLITENANTLRDVLQINDPRRNYVIYSGRSLAIREIEKEPTP